MLLTPIQDFAGLLPDQENHGKIRDFSLGAKAGENIETFCKSGILKLCELIPLIVYFVFCFLGKNKKIK